MSANSGTTLSNSVTELFEPLLSKGIFVFSPSKIPYVELDPSEEAAIDNYLGIQLDVMQDQSPTLYRIVKKQVDAGLVKIAAGIFKGKLQGNGTFTYPAQPGQLGVSFLVPQMVNYNQSAAPTGYANKDTWQLPTTAGTPAYILGSATNFYTTSSTPMTMMVIFQNGIVEVGTTSSFTQMRVQTQVNDSYGPIGLEPLVDVEVEKGKNLYIYPTPGAIIVTHDVGVKLLAMPYRTNPTGEVRLVGVLLYQYKFFADLLR
ncbi:MAG: hypothetical protein RXP86_08700 [Acidilobus sp.]